MNDLIRLVGVKFQFFLWIGCCLLVPFSVMGQSALKNIENNTTPPSRNERAPSVAEDNSKDDRVYMTQLDGIEVNNDFIKAEINKYWNPFLGKPVTHQNISDFKEWAWRKFNEAGYFAFLQLESKKSTRGEKLVIEITLPTIKEVEIRSEQAGLAETYANQILTQLGKAIRLGATVDTVDLEQKLDNLSFVLPVSLSLNIRKIDSNRVILVVDVEPKAKAELGSLLSSAVQLNNYGLSQYGRIQALGVLTFNGWTPGSTASLTAQNAEGLTYARMDYQAPSQRLDREIRFFAEQLFSKNIYNGTSATRGITSNFGVGSTRVLGNNRDLVYKSYIDLSRRSTQSKLESSGVEVSSLLDHQLRFKFSADNKKLATDFVQRLDLNLVGGHDDLNGQYYFGVLDASLQKNIDNNGLSLAIKLKAQFLPSRNLDSYNRFSLGGVNGVRAYTTLDGIGDSGTLASVELRKQVSAECAAGVFYDGGVVRQNYQPVAGQYNTAYSLQAVGLSWTGMILNHVNYNTSFAKAVGNYAAYVPGIYQTTPHAWRVNFALSYSF